MNEHESKYIIRVISDLNNLNSEDIAVFNPKFTMKFPLLEFFYVILNDFHKEYYFDCISVNGINNKYPLFMYDNAYNKMIINTSYLFQVLTILKSHINELRNKFEDYMKKSKLLELYTHNDNNYYEFYIGISNIIIDFIAFLSNLARKNEIIQTYAIILYEKEIII